eukprot:TRINITY_DN15973_c0_g1_i1.p1 TRINITY_DN15973_c0_g1~~TRINITY_DN15973_c0_g1_i1.p1  ORF type:complete len:668 (+),score=184.58 TRINITY_DN15973_c0_g1_i1:203-2206(+)
MEAVDVVDLFVPGRVCLLGEHTDWSGGFRRFNKAIDPGATLVTGTNTGLFARCKKHPSMLIVTSTDNDGNQDHCEVAMTLPALLKVAEEGGHFSYICGVAYKMLEEKKIGGLVLDNYRTTLPLKKGLSSSAAVCVLTARALNKLYDLRMTVRGEMEYAYQGELVTPSQCGRLDQACAFGSTPVVMRYNGEFTSVEKAPLAIDLHVVIVDLCAQKSTVEILTGLQAAYPHATTADHRDLHKLFGVTNLDLVARAVKLVTTPVASAEEADAARKELGALLTESQRLFDLYATPLCPSQLTAPVLHRCLSYPAIQPYILGGKGVGSQGDGTAQLLCRDSAAQRIVAEIVKEELSMEPLLLHLRPSSAIQTAVIPAGGFAGRLFPGSHACKTELFPVLDPTDGLCKPLLLHTIEMLLDAGLERVLIVIQEDDLIQFERLLEAPLTASRAAKLPEGRHVTAARKIVDMGRHVEFVFQGQQSGLGHAVYKTRDKVGENPFLLVLGHHLYMSASGRSCVQQMLDAHIVHGPNVIGLKQTPEVDVAQFGTVTGSFVADHVLNVTKVVEKPTASYAKENLHVTGMPPGEYATAFGMYALSADIFPLLEAHVRDDLRDAAGCIGLTPALDQLRQQHGLNGIIVEGERLAIGEPETFVETNSKLLQMYRDKGCPGLGA